MQIKGGIYGNSTEYVSIFVLKSDKKNESLLKRQKQKKDKEERRKIKEKQKEKKEKERKAPPPPLSPPVRLL